MALQFGFSRAATWQYTGFLPALLLFGLTTTPNVGIPSLPDPKQLMIGIGMAAFTIFAILLLCALIAYIMQIVLHVF